MDVYIYFGDSPDGITTVGMNNLIHIQDSRLKTAKGLARHLARIICLYHRAKINNKHFIILNKWDDKLGGGFTSKGDNETSKLYYELTGRKFAYLNLQYANERHVTPLVA